MSGDTASVVGVLLEPPSGAEMAAVVAAVEAAWPRAAVVVDSDDSMAAWRFSGRWWAKPAAARRQRPYIA
jgi:hypothetical protein